MEKVLLMTIKYSNILFRPKNIPAYDAIFLTMIKANTIPKLGDTPQSIHLMIVFVKRVHRLSIVINE